MDSQADVANGHETPPLPPLRNALKALRSNRGRLYPVMLALLLAGPFFTDIDGNRFHGDEADWTKYGARYFYLFFLDAAPDPEDWSTAMAIDQPQIGRYLVGGTLWLSGGSPLVVQTMNRPHYRFGESREQNLREGRVPPLEELRPVRLVMAAFGLAACLLVYWIGWRLEGPELGAIAALVCGTSPLLLVCSRRVSTDAPLLFFMLAVVALLPLLLWSHRGQRPSLLLGAGSVMGLLVGAAAGTKLNGGMAGVAFAGWIVLLAIERWLRRPRPMPWRDLWRLFAVSLMAGAMSAALFVGTSPNLYRDPVHGMRLMLYHRMKVVEAQQDGYEEDVLRTVGDTISATYRRLFVDPETRSRLSGIAHPVVEVVFLVFGCSVLARREVRHVRQRRQFSITAFVLVWGAVVSILTLIWIPLDWARYFLPILPIQAIGVAAGLTATATWLWTGR